jgi:hypothetical protein
MMLLNSEHFFRIYTTAFRAYHLQAVVGHARADDDDDDTHVTLSFSARLTVAAASSLRCIITRRCHYHFRYHCTTDTAAAYDDDFAVCVYSANFVLKRLACSQMVVARKTAISTWTMILLLRLFLIRMLFCFFPAFDFVV